MPAAASEHSSTGGGGSLVTAGQLGSESLPAEPPVIGTGGRTPPPQCVSRRVAPPTKKGSSGRAGRRVLEVIVKGILLVWSERSMSRSRTVLHEEYLDERALLCLDCYFVGGLQIA